jgi:hypothetical protein
MPKIALVTTIENNTDNKNSKILNIQREYFNEALKCFESWREFYPDIPIYALCITKATLNEEEQQQLKNLNVQYIEKYFPESENFVNGFMNVPKSISWFENVIEEDIIIHTDLDMILLKKLPESLFILEENEIKCGKYDVIARESQRVDFDTGFTIHNKSSKFYGYFWNKIQDVVNGKIKLPDGVLYYDIEEYIMQLIAEEGKYKVTPILKYQLGEGYPSVDTFSDKELENVYFWHEHLINDKKIDLIREKIKFRKRLKGLK